MLEEEIQSAISENDLRNKELLKAIKSKGVSVSDSFFAEHHFWASTQSDASFLASKLYGLGYRILVISAVKSDDGSNWWSVEAGLDRTALDAASHETTEKLVRIAAEFDSVYDGWGMSI